MRRNRLMAAKYGLGLLAALALAGAAGAQQQSPLAAAAAGPSADGPAQPLSTATPPPDLDLSLLPAPAEVRFSHSGRAFVAREYGAPDGDDPMADKATPTGTVIKTKAGRVILKQTAKCAYPTNQIYFTTATNSSQVMDMWFGSYSYNSYQFGAGDGGRVGPGANGAACTSPPAWGSSFAIAGRCSSPTTAPPPFSVGTVGMSMYNVYIDYNPADIWGAITFITSAKYYTSRKHGLERVEFIAQYWSPQKGFIHFGGPRGDGLYLMEGGRRVKDLSSKVTARLFQAPTGMVLGEWFTTICNRPNINRPSGTLKKFTKACAMAPSWFPSAFNFNNVNKAQIYGYKCTRSVPMMPMPSP